MTSTGSFTPRLSSTIEPVVNFKTSLIGSSVFPKEMLTASSTSRIKSIVGGTDERPSGCPGGAPNSGVAFATSGSGGAAMGCGEDTIDTSVGLNPTHTGETV